ncbi:RNA polymerase sigma factor [Planctomycetota bacterium]
MPIMEAIRPEELLARYNRGDSKAFKELYHHLAPPVFACLLAMLNNRMEAEEVLQAVFVEVFRRHRAMTDVTDLRGYLLRVARNKAIDSLRRKKSIKTQPLPREELLEAHPKRGGDLRKEDIRILRKLFQDLPDTQRQALALHLYSNLSFPMMAKHLGVTLHVARYQYEKALKILKEKFHGLAKS